MTIDAYAAEGHFVDHLAPIWRRLPEPGTFFVAPSVRAHAEARGIAAVPLHVPPSYRAAVASSTPTLVASYGDVKKARRMGRSRIALVQHGIGQSYGGDPRSATHASYSGGFDHADVELFLTPNEHSAARWRAAYPRARVEIVGSPRLEDLPVRGEGPVTVALTFHWECRIAPETRSGFLAFRPALTELAERFTVIGHAHPRIIGGLSRHYRHFGIEAVEDLEEVMRRADVLAFDNTSAGFEFAATGRPVVVMNPPWYRRSIDHGLRFWSAAGVGPQADGPAALPDAIERALAGDRADVDAREAALDQVFAVRKGAAERALAIVCDWAATATEAVA